MSEIAATYGREPVAPPAESASRAGTADVSGPARVLPGNRSRYRFLTCREPRKTYGIDRARGSRFPESLLHLAWRRAGVANSTISGRDGHSYRIVYPGRMADGAGPDFRDAVLERDDGKRVHGHVEIHVRQGDWKAHGHATDPGYNGVVLHVVLEDGGQEALTRSGMRVPLLVLKREDLRRFAGKAPGPAVPAAPRFDASPAAGLSLTPPLPVVEMKAAGDAWFRNRSHGHTLRTRNNGPDQAAWQGALETLGYSRNKKGFRQLAERLPWRTVRRLLDENPGIDLLPVFLRAAGLESRPHGVPRLSMPVRPSEWRTNYGRPANRPGSRIAGAAAWAVAWHAAGGPDAAFSGAARSAGNTGSLADLFVVAGTDGRTAPVGRSRARDAVVNLLLPAVHASALSRGDHLLAERAHELFAGHPVLSSNSLVREGSRMLKARGLDHIPRTAREQQGLIHIYRTSTTHLLPPGQLPLL